jgi:phospholipid transport system transporter-binding protein
MGHEDSAPPIDVLTFQTATAALEKGFAAIRSGQTVFDLKSITLADSSGVALLLAWQRRARAAGQPLSYVNMPASLATLANLYGVSEMVTSV